ncbi:MAG: nucleotide exchange factor GrpE [Balneolaceae bacterium]
MSAEDIKEAEEKTNEEIVDEEVVETAEVSETETAEEVASEIEVDEQEVKIQKLEQDLADARDTVLRKAAELENVRKRVQRERVALFEDAKIAALEDFLPISEDMKRALGAVEGNEVNESFLEGVKLVANKFEEVLAKYGVESIDETGIPFDVNLHDAMLRQPAPKKKIKSDTVLQVLESGYRIGNKVIKHAKVIVSE